MGRSVPLSHHATPPTVIVPQACPANPDGIAPPGQGGQEVSKSRNNRGGGLTYCRNPGLALSPRTPNAPTSSNPLCPTAKRFSPIGEGPLSRYPAARPGAPPGYACLSWPGFSGTSGGKYALAKPSP